MIEFKSNLEVSKEYQVETTLIYIIPDSADNVTKAETTNAIDLPNEKNTANSGDITHISLEPTILGIEQGINTMLICQCRKLLENSESIADSDSKRPTSIKIKCIM